METDENLPSNTTRTAKPGGERGGGKPTTNDDDSHDLKDAVEDLLDGVRVKNKEIHDDDVEEVIKLTEKLLKEGYSKKKHDNSTQGIKICGVHLWQKKT